MRKRNKQPKLGRDTAHRKALLRNLSQELFKHGRIVTTLAKAKALRPYVEPLITRAKIGGVQAERILAKIFYDRAVVDKALKEVGPLFKDRNGGYTRIIKIGKRPGDNVEEAMIALVVNEKEVKDSKKDAVKAKNN